MASKSEIKKCIKECKEQCNRLEQIVKEKYGLSLEEYIEKRKKGEL